VTLFAFFYVMFDLIVQVIWYQGLLIDRLSWPAGRAHRRYPTEQNSLSRRYVC